MDVYVIDYNQIWIDIQYVLSLLWFSNIFNAANIVCEYRRAKYVYFTIK